jgi:hypothetical protein
MMSEQQIEKALHKIYQTLLFKNNIKFRVEVDPQIKYDEHLLYSIIVYFTVDHSKFWSESPEFSTEYNHLINYIREDFEERMDDVTKYVLPTESYSVWVRFEHYNTDVYKPLLDSVGEIGVPFISEFSEVSPNIEIVLDENHESDFDTVYRELETKFDVDDILIYWGYIS